MALRRGETGGAGPSGAGWRSRRAGQVLAGAALAGILSVGLTACGSTFKGTLSVSVSSGPVGTVVHVNGDAGKGCVVDTNWLGFDFERYGQLTRGPAMEMTTPVATNGTWSAEFVVPSYMGGSDSRGPGALVTPGRYEVSANTCGKGVVATASFQVTAGVPAGTGTDYVALAVTPDGGGYWLVQGDGVVSTFGDARSYGSLAPGQLTPPAHIVGIARTYTAKGYWLVSTDGHVYTFGDARAYGSLSSSDAAAAPVTNISPAPDGKGYWLLGANGHVFGFGAARSDGSPNNYLAPYDAIEARPAGGYVVTSASDGGVYTYPGATALSSFGPGSALSGMLVGTAVTASGNGTWQAGLDGGVITSGDATFYGSVPSISAVLKAPVTAIAATPAGHGYWLLAADGTVFNFGDAAALAATPKS